MREVKGRKINCIHRSCVAASREDCIPGRIVSAAVKRFDPELAVTILLTEAGNNEHLKDWRRIRQVSGCARRPFFVIINYTIAGIYDEMKAFRVTEICFRNIGQDPSKMEHYCDGAVSRERWPSARCLFFTGKKGQDENDICIGIVNCLASI